MFSDQVALYINIWRGDKHYTYITSSYYSCEIGIWSSIDFGVEIYESKITLRCLDWRCRVCLVYIAIFLSASYW